MSEKCKSRFVAEEQLVDIKSIGKIPFDPDIIIIDYKAILCMTDIKRIISKKVCIY